MLGRAGLPGRRAWRCVNEPENPVLQTITTARAREPDRGALAEPTHQECFRWHMRKGYPEIAAAVGSTREDIWKARRWKARRACSLDPANPPILPPSASCLAAVSPFSRLRDS